jgi:hypothetical protein
MKLKKKPKNPLFWEKKPKKTQKNPKKNKKTQKTQKTQKNPLGWFFYKKKPWFFPTLLNITRIYPTAAYGEIVFITCFGICRKCNIFS